MAGLQRLPIDLSLVVGDAAHSLRSALDYLACELVRSANVVPKNVYFPICESAGKYDSDSAGKTRGMPAAAKEIIDKIAPYQGGNDVLWALHLLDITDKHRLLITIGAQMAQTTQLKLSLEPTEFSVLFHSPELKEGDILGEVSGSSEEDHRINFNFDIAFGQPEGLAGEPIVSTLSYMSQMVEAIVTHFDNNF